MSIALTCLGGAAAWPNPGQGCSSYLVRLDETALVLDCGPDTLLELSRHIDFHTVDAIVISHLDSDHFLDLIPYRYGLTYGPSKPTQPIPLWLPPGGKHKLEQLGRVVGGDGESDEHFWDKAFVVAEYDPAAVLRLGSLNVTFALTQHHAVCYAMRLQGRDGSTLTYTADTGSIASVLQLARESNILISEATVPENSDRAESRRVHLKPSEAGQLAHQANVDVLVLSHLWAGRPDSEVVEAAATYYGGTIHVAKPGLVVHAR